MPCRDAVAFICENSIVSERQDGPLFHANCDFPAGVQGKVFVQDKDLHR